MKKPTVTIGIPAFNEYQNLRRLLPSLMNQYQKHYILERIVVISDGSTDETGSLASGRLPKYIRVVADKTRKGKPSRINEIFHKSSSDYVVILDADVKIFDHKVVDELFVNLPKADAVLISGAAHPLPPENIIGSVALAGVQIWNKARSLAPDSELYLTEGSIRAFSKAMYKNITFPDTTADDAFSYIVCRINNWVFRYRERAVVFNRLPSSLKDYYLQQRRYLISPFVQQEHFEGYNIGELFTITKKQKVVAVLMHMARRPLATVLYVLFIAYIKIDLKIKRELYTSKWAVLPTTKTANI